MKKVILFTILLVCSFPAFCQDTGNGTKTPVDIPNSITNSTGYTSNYYRSNFIGRFYLPFLNINRFAVQSEVLYSGQGPLGSLPFTTPGSFRSARLNAPVQFRYQIFNGVNLQAGSQLGSSMVGSRQAKVGASFHLANGVNFTAGYGAGLNNFNKLGYGTGTRNQGLQITAGYRLFK